MANKYLWIPGNSPPLIDEHSLAKHRIFRGYVRAYIERFTRNPQADRFRFSIVDGFSGGGNYTFEQKTISGSPLIVLEEIRDAKIRLAAERRKQFSLEVDLICVDAAKPHLDYLRQTILDSEFRDQLDQTVFTVHKEFEAALPDIIAHIAKRGREPRGLFLLDQYGYRDASLAIVRRILDEIKNSEVILTFAVDSLINFMSESDTFLKAVGPVELTRSKVRELIEAYGSSARQGRWLAENGLYQHFRDATGAPYYTPFFVRSSDSNRAYWLLHASKHPTARDVMGELHWSNQNTCSHYGGDGLFALGFDPEYSPPRLEFGFTEIDRARSIERITSQLPDIVTKATSSQNDVVSFERFFSLVCNETPATKSIITTSAIALRDEKELEIVDVNGKPKPRAMAIDWQDGIRRPLAPKLFGPWAQPKRK